ncbi:alginate biosynthesis protein AlgJ [Oleiphilus messinensis]|uniref:Probable alginate O-acetylase AlgJ n=1 Tax=Oleiphilus messinensis TaxID=141451 RepID=A0A1Y0IDY5_9GAMM|nr:alginate O-acetyltransferase [Oleiphilus messinensis]ARU58480.1 alginate biosynthesis protein AlgJ [Oleiphilus messinensis]
MEKLALYSQGSLFVIVVLVIGVLSLRAINDYNPDQQADWASGQQTSVYEKHYDKELPVREVGINIWAAIEYVLFREGRSGVVIGHDDWLFTEEEFRSYSIDEDKTPENLEFIKAVSNKLETEGIALIISTVPAKARVYPEYTGTESPSAAATARYAMFQQWLKSNGIARTDLLLPLMESKNYHPMYLRTDTHWTPWGAQIAANTIAREVQMRFPDLIGSGSFKSTFTPEIEHQGDLFSYVPLGNWFAWLGPRPDTITPTSTEKIESDAQVLDLFGDDQTIEITLVGTSYSANPAWNFPGFLKEALATDLLDFSQEGKGPFEPMLDYLRSEEFQASPPVLVLWEIPERFLPVDYSEKLDNTIISKL